MNEEKKTIKSFKDIAKIDRPREKLAQSGPSALKDEELLAIILRTGYKGKNVLELSRDILKKYPGDTLVDAAFSELALIKGVGSSKAAVIIAAIELIRRLVCKTEEMVIIKTPEDAYRYVPEIRKANKEKLVVIYLNTRNSVLKRETISIGSLNANIVHPREVFKPAIACSAASVILVHNHPSGDTTASDEDIEVTKRIIEAGKIVGIEVLDHIIVSNRNYKSMKEEGLF